MMKFKKLVLFSLIMCMVLVMAGSAFGAAVISLKSKSNLTYTFKDEAKEYGQFPLLRFSVTNTEATSITIATIVVSPGGSSSGGGDEFRGNVWVDVNKNGKLDKGDTNLNATTLLLVGGTTSLNIDDQAVAAGDSMLFLVTVGKTAAAITDNALAYANPGTIANVPQTLISAAAAEALNATAHSDAATVLLIHSSIWRMITEHLVLRLHLPGRLSRIY